MRTFKLALVLALTLGANQAWSITCRPYRAQEVGKGYTLPWISGIQRLVTASNCSPRNSYHSSSAVHMHNINDGTFAYDFRMRYEPVCAMRAGWIIEFRDSEPDLEGKRLAGRSNFVKILNADNRVDYYTHLRNSWWAETGQPEFNYVNRRQKVLNLGAAQGKFRWVHYTDGRRKLLRSNGGQISFQEMSHLSKSSALDDLYVPQGHCFAISGSSGTNAPHLHVESRCSLQDSRTCPIEFVNAFPVGNKSQQPETGVLGELRTYLAH